jgi:hypothetical protein
LAVAIGYFYTVVIVIPHILAYPGAFPVLLSAGTQSSAYLYFFWINGTALGAIAYALLADLRALFGKTNLKREPIDVNEAAATVLRALGGELRDHGIVTHIEQWRRSSPICEV